MPVPEDVRQTAITVMKNSFEDKGMEPEDAAKAAEMFVDEAIQRGDS